MYNLKLRKVVLTKKEGPFSYRKNSLNEIFKSTATVEKLETTRSFFVEDHCIYCSSSKCLKQIKTYREEGQPIVYTNKNYIHSSHMRILKVHHVQKEVPNSKGKQVSVLRKLPHFTCFDCILSESKCPLSTNWLAATRIASILS